MLALLGQEARLDASTEPLTMTYPPVLSVSQAERFDPEQRGGCQRRWWFEDVRKFRPDDTTGQEDGHAGHALLRTYLTGGVLPKRARMLKTVRGAIDSGRLPHPGPHLQVEQRFSGQPHVDATGQRVPLDMSRTLWHAGHPWEGFIDLRFRHRDGAATVWDHKFSSDIHERALPAEKLIRTVQMPIYALDTLRTWPDARAVNLVHLYVSRRGVESFIRHQRVSVEQVHERADEVTRLVRQMDAAREAASQDDVPFNRAACHAYTGCPHQFRCNAFRRKNMAMDLNEEEARMFGMLSDEAPRPAPVTAEAPLAAPTCEACGEALTPENSSRLKTGDVKHIGCARGGINLSEGGAIVIDAVSIQTTAKCVNCPHPPHEGKPCTGRRGGGQCRCGATAEQPQRVVPPAPKHEVVHAWRPGDTETMCGVIVDGVGGSFSSKWGAATCSACVEACRALEPVRVQMGPEAVAEPEPSTDAGLDALRGVPEVADALEGLAQDAQRIGLEDALAESKRRVTELEEQLQTLREIQDDPELSGQWSGKLAVNITVELGPATLTFLAGLVKR